jgi:peptidoglycan/xylan/chitin deacetylase (PgdA/CDA1 family)
MSEDKSISSSKRKQAHSMIVEFDKKLASEDALEKIAYNEIKSELKESKDKMKGIRPKSVSASEIPPSFAEDQANLKLLRENRNKFRFIGRFAESRNDELNQQIERESDNLQLIDQKGREPQQADLKYFPSNGTNGNIVGLIFPKNVWALTYDDGPNPTHTPAVVKNLEELGIKATFFWLAQNVIKYPDVVNLVKENGHQLENHSWSHAQLTKQGPEQLKKEIVDSTVVEAKAYGERPKFFRCPYGAGTNVPHIRKIISEQGMIHVFWNVDTLDWQDKDPDSIVERAKKQMIAAGHGVVLFHDVHPQSVIASKKLVEWSKSLKGEENKIRWVTIPEIVKELNGAQK